MPYQFSKKRQRSARTEEVLIELETALKQFARECDATGGLLVRGITISPSTQGDGWLCILRVYRSEIGEIPPEYGDVPVGHHVGFAHGETLLEALAELEARLALGELRLTDDRYAREDAPRTHSKGARIGTGKGKYHK